MIESQTLDVGMVCKAYQGKFRELKKEQALLKSPLHYDDIFKCELDRLLIAKLFRTFKQTKVKSVNIEYGNDLLKISSIEHKFNYNLNVKTKGVIMSKQNVESGLKLEMNVGDLRKFLEGIDSKTKLQVDYPLSEGMCEDQLSHFKYDKKSNKLILNPLDTCIIYDMDKDYPNDVKGSEMVYAFSPEHKKITNEYHGRV